MSKYLHFAMFPGNHCLLSIWYTDPPFRVHHHARRIMEFEWENEHDDSGSKLLTLTVTYQADGNYLIEVIPPLIASLVMFKGPFISLSFSSFHYHKLELLLYVIQVILSMHMQMGEDGSYISEVKATYLGEHKFRVEFDGVSTDVHLAVYNKVNAFFKCI